MAGKNSTPCQEMKKEGTDVILIDMDPTKYHEVVCDCVGILKERHSDIETKMPKQTRQRKSENWKRKTTKCRMVFRAEVHKTHSSSITCPFHLSIRRTKRNVLCSLERFFAFYIRSKIK